MAEEMSQEERVKSHQVSIAKSMKVDKEILDILQNIKEWHIREWLYVCGLDGMPAEQIRTLAEGNASVTKIKKARKDFLKNLWVDMGDLEQQVVQMREEVTSVCTASKEARSVIERGLEEALKKQTQAQETTIQAKDQLIQMLKKQIEAMEKEREQNPGPMISNEAEADHVPATGTIEEKSQESAVKNEKGKGFFAKIISDMDTKHFIHHYIQSDEYHPDQKEYFLACLEEGMSVKEIESIAAPGLSVEVMRRLRELKGAGSQGRSGRDV